MKAMPTSEILRAVFISDVHLGSKYCHAEELAEFLGNLQCKRLYLVGDIVDLWWMAQNRAVWREPQNHVIEALHQLTRQGTELVYVPGNHDRPLRRFLRPDVTANENAPPCYSQLARWPPFIGNAW
jgi:UDP-2,3-diacylglucosamine pyrophosphatase LpxH